MHHDGHTLEAKNLGNRQPVLAAAIVEKPARLIDRSANVLILPVPGAEPIPCLSA